MHGQGTFASAQGWSFTGSLSRNRPLQGLLTLPDLTRQSVTYAPDCSVIHNAPTPATAALIAPLSQSQ